MQISFTNFLIYCFFLSFLSLCGDTSLQPSKHLLPCIKYNNILVSDSKKNHENSSANWMKNRSIFAKKKKKRKEKEWKKFGEKFASQMFYYHILKKLSPRIINYHNFSSKMSIRSVYLHFF